MLIVTVRWALVEATLDTAYKSVVTATCHLVSFATPHQGGNYATVGYAVTELVRTSLRKPKNDLVGGLGRSSDAVTRRFEQSRHLSDKVVVTSFFEGEQFGKLGLVSINVFTCA